MGVLCTGDRCTRGRERERACTAVGGGSFNISEPLPAPPAGFGDTQPIVRVVDSHEFIETATDVLEKPRFLFPCDPRIMHLTPHTLPERFRELSSANRPWKMHKNCPSPCATYDDPTWNHDDTGFSWWNIVQHCYVQSSAAINSTMKFVWYLYDSFEFTPLSPRRLTSIYLKIYRNFLFWFIVLFVIINRL